MKGLFEQHTDPGPLVGKHRTPEERLAWAKRYRQSPKYKAARRRYRQSDRGRAYRERYLQTDNYKASKRKSYLLSRQKHPNRSKAHNAVNQAIEHGKLCAAYDHKCLFCDEQAVLYHHYIDYEPEHWLNVFPVCGLCHYYIHKLKAQIDHVKRA